MKRLVIILLLFTSSLAATEVAEQKFAALGNFQLENGQEIKDLKLGYRTVGVLNADQSNAVLFPT
jgi:homoserine O-acetyltransferase